jgi:glycosyltransferase involved in cell wall biosynthesis
MQQLELESRPRPATEGGRPVAAGGAPARALRVAVLVDLLWTPKAGGHVKFWERAAAGAVGRADLDLTIVFAAAADGVHALAGNVRYRLLRPVFSTQRLGFLGHVPDHTDLAPYHGRLARELARYDVLHTTDAYFAYARTALRVARRHGIPLVNSVHTDTPGYTRLYTAETVRRLLGRGWLARLLLERLHVDRFAERRKLAQLRRHQAAAAFVLGPRDQDLARAREVLPPERVLRLPRGLELDRFNPRWRDRAWTERQFALAPGTAVVLCVGRVNVGKNVMVLAEAVRELAAAGRRIVLICAGEGEDRGRIAALLGPHARCPGVVLGDDLARLYASADLVAHPSEIESYANAVAEGMAAGVPVLVSANGQPRWQIVDQATGLAVGPSAAEWARAIALLLDDPARRADMGRAARLHMEERFSDWREVVAQELLPVWRRAAQLAPPR